MRRSLTILGIPIQYFPQHIDLPFSRTLLQVCVPNEDCVFTSSTIFKTFRNLNYDESISVLFSLLYPIPITTTPKEIEITHLSIPNLKSFSSIAKVIRYQPGSSDAKASPVASQIPCFNIFQESIRSASMVGDVRYERRSIQMKGPQDLCFVILISESPRDEN